MAEWGRWNTNLMENPNPKAIALLYDYARRLEAAEKRKGWRRTLSKKRH